MRIFVRFAARIALLCVVVLFVFSTSDSARAEEYKFQSEVSKVMDIIINSLYKTKEIFLRELVSNASDAIEKMHILSLKTPELNKLTSGSRFNISIHPDAVNNVLIIQDNGIGMTYNDLKNNLGTIAKSGTADFLAKKIATPGENNLIGQFGVGFYSAFLVADSVEVITKNPEDKQYVWHSNAKDTFTIKEDIDSNVFLEHGTRITLKLKKEISSEFTNEDKLKNLILRYSEFVNFPIYLNISKEIEIENTEAIAAAAAEAAAKAAEATEKKDKKMDEKDGEKNSDDITEDDSKITEEKKEKLEKKKKSDDDDVDDDDVDDAATDDKEDATKKIPKIKKTIRELVHVNVHRPIWTRDPKSLNESDYSHFYKGVFKDSSDPLKSIHFKGEGGFDFYCLLFIPRRPQHNVMQLTSKNFEHNVRLFVRRVFITDELSGFLPRFLGFLKGLVDSDDFPLNVARENVQENKKMGVIKKVLVNKVISTINNLAKNDTEYKKFYNEYSGYLKMGVIESEDDSLKLKISKLLRFTTTFNITKGAPLVSFNDYVSRIRKNQTDIFYLTGESVKSMRKSPYLELLVGRGYEVILMDDSLDEYMMQRFPKFGDYHLRNIAKGDFKFTDETDSEKEEFEKLKTQFEPLTKFLTNLLNKTIDDTTISRRLKSSSCALVAPEHGWSGNFQRMMANQRNGDGLSTYYMSQKKKLEINPNHPIMISLLAKVEADAVDKDVEDLARSLHDIALIAGNYPLDEVVSITRRMENAVRLGLNVDLTSEANILVRPAPEIDTEAKILDIESEKEKELDEQESSVGNEKNKDKVDDTVAAETPESSDKAEDDESVGVSGDDHNGEL